ncbi:unnamed protein product [Mesocestoides corti]|uniref:Integrase catalytic domain-containing protein n=1 Tax=Mesocestoides corti TaxID=53468 RepID=A0A0R3UD86_MESCO|nr:unnamed protein product [Mesocestoides corti]
MQDISAETVAKTFVDRWVALFGVPSTITTDRGTQFESSLFRNLTRLLGTNRIRTTTYHLWTYCLSGSAVHSSTGLTPAVMNFAHELRLPADVVAPPPREPDYVGPSEYVDEARRQLRLSFDSARSQLALAHKRQKDYYDKQAHGTAVEEGDLVWMAATNAVGEGRKWQHTWKGP